MLLLNAGMNFLCWMLGKEKGGLGGLKYSGTGCVYRLLSFHFLTVDKVSFVWENSKTNVWQGRGGNERK